MAFNMMFYSKEAIPQTVPNQTDFAIDMYSSYADSFDLSFLKSEDTTVSTTTMTNPVTINKIVSSSSNSSITTTSSNTTKQQQSTLTVAEVASQLSPEYIPATVFPDSLQSVKKTINNWATVTNKSNNNNSNGVNNNNISIAMEEDPPAYPNFNNNNNNINSTIPTSSSSTSNNRNTGGYKFTNPYKCPLPSPPQEIVTSTVPFGNMPSPSYPSQTTQLFDNGEQQHQQPMHLISTTTATATAFIKQEHIILPPSPPESDSAFESDVDVVKNESSASPSSIDYADSTESCIDIEYFLKSSFDSMNQISSTSVSSSSSCNSRISSSKQDHQFLRECLQDTSFQKRHNLRPVALESLFGGWNLRGDIEPVISLALEQAKCDIKATCSALDISPDPRQWSPAQAHSWLRSTIHQFKLQPMPNLESLFPENGQELTQMTEDDFTQRCPETGSTLHAQLEVWIAACADESFNNSCDDATNFSAIQFEDPSDIVMTTIKNEADEVMVASPSSTSPSPSPSCSATNSPSISTTSTTTTTNTSSSPNSSTTLVAIKAKSTRHGSAHIHLWQFLKELLAAPQTYGTALRWLDRKQGIFKIEDSVRVARLWGRRKNRPAMNYDKLSRSIRQYYKKGIMKKTERSQRLVYQFCHPYFL